MHERKQMETGLGGTVRRMLMSQPPLKEMAISVWERTGSSRTIDVLHPRIPSHTGITPNMGLKKLGDLFDTYQDLNAFKLTIV
jgi:hypothetical protein